MRGIAYPGEVRPRWSWRRREGRDLDEIGDRIDAGDLGELDQALQDRSDLVPILLGRGERLFDGDDDLHGLRLVRTVAAPKVTHLKFTRS